MLQYVLDVMTECKQVPMSTYRGTLGVSVPEGVQHLRAGARRREFVCLSSGAVATRGGEGDVGKNRTEEVWVFFS